MKIIVGKPGKPGPTLPWEKDEHGGWHREAAGLTSDGDKRVVATVDKYPSGLGNGFFYCVGDGPDEVSADGFSTLKDAKEAADKQLLVMGYSFKEME